MSSNPLERANTLSEVDGESECSGTARIIENRRRSEPGAVIADKYVVERELAEGGLGIVVVARHRGLDRPVAIKYLKPEILASDVLVERFRREAQLAVSIRSDHVVRVYDVGDDPFLGPFMVMEYLEGEDLGALLERGPLPTALAIDYLIQTCDALAEAHALGIAHRDLKPENLFLARRPNSTPIVKILDFGISKVYEKEKAAPGAPRVRKMTEDGLRLGTPVYMSPEQLLTNSGVDARSDIWALGVVLFELLTGKLPFDGENVPQLGANIVASPPTPLRAYLPTASPALEAVILKCLEKKPDARYRNVAELVEELVRFEAPASEPRIERIKRVIVEGGESIRPPRALGVETPIDVIVPMPLPAAPKKKPTRLLMGIAAAALLLLGGIAFLATRHEAPPPTPAVELERPPPPVVTHVPPPVVVEIPSARPVVSASAPRPVAPPRPPPPPRKSGFDYSTFGERR